MITARRLIVLPVLLLSVFSNSASANTLATPTPPAINAKAWLLIDHDSGQVLVSHESETRVRPASLTKLAVAYLAFQELRSGKIKLTDVITVSEHAANAIGTRLFLRAGEKISVQDLIMGMLAVSANDAAIALAEHISGKEPAFVERMNALGKTLGMNATHFNDATGLSEDLSSARDLARLAIALWRDFPEHHPWFSLREFTHEGIRQFNRNALLWRDPSVDGIKTGHTHTAGFCLVASAQRGGMRLMAVILGADDENARVVAGQQLLDYGFRYFETRRLYAARTELTRVRIWMGSASELALGPAQAVYVTLPRGWHERVHAWMSVKQSRLAPVRAGQVIGRLTVDLDHDPIAEYPLVALEDVERGNVFQQLYDHIRLQLH